MTSALNISENHIGIVTKPFLLKFVILYEIELYYMSYRSLKNALPNYYILKLFLCFMENTLKYLAIIIVTLYS